MIHVRKSKIDQEKAKLWGVEEDPFFNAPHYKSTFLVKKRVFLKVILKTNYTTRNVGFLYR